MRGRHRALAALVVLLGLTACGANPPRTEAARFAAEIGACVDHIGQVPVAAAIPFSAERSERWPKRSAFDTLASCVLADDGQPVPIVLLGIEHAVPLDIELNLLMRNQIALAATVELLDEQRRVRRSVPFSSFVRRGGAYTGTIFLTAEDQPVRYLLLRPDPQAVGGSDTTIVGQTHTHALIVPAGGGFVGASFTTGSEVLAQTWLSEIGDFAIRAVPGQGADRRE